jgi:hypothetical protein
MDVHAMVALRGFEGVADRVGPVPHQELGQRPARRIAAREVLPASPFGLGPPAFGRPVGLEVEQAACPAFRRPRHPQHPGVVLGAGAAISATDRQSPPSPPAS